jgi:hypothetical protein
MLQLRYFDEGKRSAFFTAWSQYVPASAVSFDLLTLKASQGCTMRHTTGTVCRMGLIRGSYINIS